jgi:DNA-binding transcriptional LysR family regulator
MKLRSSAYRRAPCLLLGLAITTWQQNFAVSGDGDEIIDLSGAGNTAKSAQSYLRKTARIASMGPFQLSNLDVKQLRIFTAVVENEGVSAAAYALGANLTAVSRSLSELEDRLGVRLCRRGRGGFELTPQGLSIYEHAKRLTLELNEFETSVRIISQAVKGRFRIGIIDNTLSNPASRLVQGLNMVAQAYPDLFVELSLLSPPAIEIALRERRLDVGITAQPTGLSPLEYTEAFSEQHRIYISRDHPRRTEIEAAFAGKNHSLETIPFIARRYKAPTIDKLEQSYHLSPVATVDSVETAATLIAAGFGVGVLPTHYADLLSRLDLVEVAAPETPLILPFFIAHRSDMEKEPAIRMFRKFLLQQRPKGDSTEQKSRDARHLLAN